MDLPIDRLEIDGPPLLRRKGEERSARRLEAVFELLRRMSKIPLARGDPVTSPQVLADRLRPRFRDAIREQFVAVLVDGQNRVLREVTVSVGTLDATLVVPRDALVEAIRESASGVLFVHNHPSGNVLPSPEDVRVTHRLREVCALAGIRFLDHVIVGESSHYSFQEEGM